MHYISTQCLGKQVTPAKKNLFSHNQVMQFMLIAMSKKWNKLVKSLTGNYEGNYFEEGGCIDFQKLEKLEQMVE